jgi:Ion channel
MSAGPVMGPQRGPSQATRLRRPTFPAVLGMLVAVIVIVPLVEGLADLRAGVMLGLAGLTIPILAVAAASDRSGHRRVAFALAAISVLANGATLPHGGVPLWAGGGTSLIFLAYTTFLVLRAVVRSAHVTLEIIAGALASYVMIGLTWAIAFGVVETRWPGSIRFAGDNLEVRFSDLLYFSYVTLLTIGYGDITPVSPAARTLVVVEGLLGMAFTTVLLAVLVAKALGRREDV